MVSGFSNHKQTLQQKKKKKEQKTNHKQNHNTWIRKHTHIFERIYRGITQVFGRLSKDEINVKAVQQLL